MPTSTQTPTASVSSALYMMAAVLVVTPLLGMVALLPAQPSMQTWRFSAEGLLANLLLLPTVGVALAVLTAAAAGHRRLLQVLTILNVLAAIAIAVLLVRLGLDALQLRHELAVVQAQGVGRPAGLRGFDANVFKSASEYAVAWLAAVVFAWQGRRAARALRPSRATRAAAPSPLLLSSAPAEGNAPAIP